MTLCLMKVVKNDVLNHPRGVPDRNEALGSIPQYLGVENPHESAYQEQDDTLATFLRNAAPPVLLHGMILDSSLGDGFSLTTQPP